MLSFEDARRVVKRAWPAYDLATYGYETDQSWLVLPLPATVGSRIAAVDKRSGDIRWITENDPEYTQQHPVGRR